MEPISFDRHRFPPEIICYAVWLYAKFTLSFRDVEDLLAERSLDVSFEAVRRWCLKFGSAIARNLRSTRPTPGDHWHLGEMVIVIRGKRYWLWRAVDNEGEASLPTSPDNALYVQWPLTPHCGHQDAVGQTPIMVFVKAH